MAANGSKQVNGEANAPLEEVIVADHVAEQQKSLADEADYFMKTVISFRTVDKSLGGRRAESFFDTVSKSSTLDKSDTFVRLKKVSTRSRNT